MTHGVSSVIRLGLVRARVAAMTAGADRALAEIDSMRDRGVHRPVDAAAIGILQSEVNFLDNRLKAAVGAFTVYVEPVLDSVDPRIATVIADNKSSLLFEGFSPEAADHFYHLVDQRRALGVELWDHAAVLEAVREGAKGKHHESLPIYWQQLRAAYQRQNWRSMAVAEGSLARECISLGWLSDASYHAMLSRDKQTMQTAADALLASRSSDGLRASLSKLLKASSLKKHAMQVASLLRTVADAVPEDQLAAVVQWLTDRVSFVPEGWHDTPFFDRVWEAVEAVAPRMDSKAAASFVAVATDHPLMAGGVSRRHLISALNCLCARLQRPELLPLADTAVSLVRDRKSDMDYREAMNLLCHVAYRGGDETKAHIRTLLLPPGTVINDAVLLQAAGHLGWTPQHPERFPEHARHAAASIRQQVQHVAAGETAAQIGGYGTLGKATPTGHDVITLHGAEHLVDALAPYGHLIDASSLAELLRAMLAMIAESSNVIVNRASLTVGLRSFMAWLPDGLDREIAEVLEPLAEGQITESHVGQTYAEATNPLNRYKMNSGDPVDLRGAALQTLAKLDHIRSGSSSRLHKDLLLKALTSPDADVRRYGLVAAETSGRLSPAEQTAVALAGLDPEPKVAGLAMRALARAAKSLRFGPQTWHIALRCLEAAAHSGDANHRWAAGQVIAAVSRKKIPTEMHDRFTSVTSVLSADICYSVRASLLDLQSEQQDD